MWFRMNPWFYSSTRMTIIIVSIRFLEYLVIQFQYMLSNRMFFGVDTGTQQGSFVWRGANNLQQANVKVGAQKLAGSRQRISIYELNDYFKIEVPIAGFKREEIHISIQNQVLTLCCERRQECTDVKRKSSKRKIILPENADIDFATAEYREGVVNIFLYKTCQPNHHRRVHVSVY